MPIAAKTTRNFEAEEGTVDWLTIWAVILPAGRPEPENTGSFCPRTRVFIISMDEMPVWIKALGLERLTGFRGSP
jgi:hypothetical protein